MKKYIFILLLLISGIGYGQAVLTPVNVGTTANDRTGDPLRTAMQKLNANDEALSDEIDTKADLAGSKIIGVALSDLTTELVAGTEKAYFRMPMAMTVTAVRASLLTAQTGGSILTIDIHESGTTILSTKLTIDNTEKTSTTATPAVISDTALADDAEITFDIDLAGDDGTGLIVWIIGY